MRLLDLFCGAGGAAMGYFRAGFAPIVRYYVLNVVDITLTSSYNVSEMASTAPTSNLPYSLMKVYVESYNQANRMLTLALCLSNFDAVSISDPLDILPALQANYQQITIAVVEAAMGLQRVEDGEEFPDYNGNMVQIEEDYILELVDFGVNGKTCLASVIDPQEVFPFRYSKVLLVYRPPDALSPVGPIPLGWNTEALDPAWGYPAGAVSAWKFPSLGNNAWRPIIGNIYNGSPGPHMRCWCAGEWSWLLTQQEMGEGDIWDCFRWSIPADGGPWFSGRPLLISKGVNDSWFDSSEEITLRRNNTFDTIGTAIHWLHTHLGWQPTTDYRLREMSTDSYLDISVSEQGDSNTDVKKPINFTGGSFPSVLSHFPWTGAGVSTGGNDPISVWKRKRRM